MNTANGAARYAQAGWWFIQIKTPCPVLHVQYKNIQICTMHMSKYPKRHILSIRTQKKRKDKFDKFDQDFIAISNITHAENCFYCILCHIFLRVTTWKCSLIDIISVERYIKNQRIGKPLKGWGNSFKQPTNQNTHFWTLKQSESQGNR